MNFDVIAGKTFTLSNRGNLHKTMHYIQRMARESASDPAIKKIASELAQQPNPVEAVFRYVYNNVAYLKDEADKQQLRWARRSLNENKGNCTAYSILISALLQNMNIPHRFKVVAYERGSQKEHIYVQTNDGIVLDPVIGQQQDNTDTLYNRDGGHFNTEIKYLTAYYYNP